jgi:Arc/MetJ-type ribon-helix-helix transcriptional regulator
MVNHIRLTMTYVSKTKTIGTKITLAEYEEVLALIEAGRFISASDFVREAIRDKLKSTEIIKLRDISYEDAKKEVLGYFRKYDEAYISEAADDLELDLQLVHRIITELEQEGRLKGV